MAKRLSKNFYARDTIQVAQELLGKRLIHQLPGGTRLAGRIVETEAYLGVEDPAAHVFGGRRTERTEAMYAEPGTSYVYFIYGVHFCLNVSTVARDVPEAVLIRALDPLEGVERMLAENPRSSRELLANGPGKLCRALHIAREQNALDMTTSQILWIEEDGALMDVPVIEGPRVGIGDRHDAVHWPLRFGIEGHPSLSPPKFPNYLE
jgi:DNA-3-methyladenine glycosylase